jgi:hypothetical protein
MLISLGIQTPDEDHNVGTYEVVAASTHFVCHDDSVQRVVVQCSHRGGSGRVRRRMPPDGRASEDPHLEPQHLFADLDVSACFT